MAYKQQIPNLLTFARVAVVPICLLIMLIAPERPAFLLWLFIAASLTDYLDGYLARRWNVVSPLGTMLDPVADKLLVALMLIYLLCSMKVALIHDIFSPIFVAVIIILLRELYISGLREFLAARQIALPVSKGGKWKTALQMIAITLLLVFQATDAAVIACHHGEDIPDCGRVSSINAYSFLSGVPLLYISALLALTSAFSYTRAALRHIK